MRRSACDGCSAMTLVFLCDGVGEDECEKLDVTEMSDVLLSAKMSGRVASPVWQMCMKGNISV